MTKIHQITHLLSTDWIWIFSYHFCILLPPLLHLNLFQVFFPHWLLLSILTLGSFKWAICLFFYSVKQSIFEVIIILLFLHKSMSSWKQHLVFISVYIAALSAVFSCSLCSHVHSWACLLDYHLPFICPSKFNFSKLPLCVCIVFNTRTEKSN